MGLCRACSPQQISLYELDRNGTWVNATRKHRQLLEKWAEVDILSLEAARQRGDHSEAVRLALTVYLAAESGGFERRYRAVANRALRENGRPDLAALIDEAARRGVRLVDLEPESPDVSKHNR